MKFEFILTYWKDGLFKSRDRIEADNTDSLREQFDIAMDKMIDKIDEDNKPKSYEVDDDIPF